MELCKFDSEKIKLLAFDVDGTIFSSEDIIAPTYQKAIKQFNQSYNRNLKVPDHDSIMLEIGKPVKTIFRNLLPEIQESDRDTISDSVLGLLCAEIRSGKGHIYEGVQETIHTLFAKNYILVIASNGRAPYLETITDVAGIHHSFGHLVTINNQNIKTKGEILEEYTKLYNITPESILMIGDRFSDYEAALTTGSPFAFCEYGHAVTGEIPSWSLKLSQISDLLDFL